MSVWVEKEVKWVWTDWGGAEHAMGWAKEGVEEINRRSDDSVVIEIEIRWLSKKWDNKYLEWQFIVISTARSNAEYLAVFFKDGQYLYFKHFSEFKDKAE